MSFFITPTETALDAVTDRMVQDPIYADRYAAIKELRSIDDGLLHRGNEFRRVASLQGPLKDLALVLNPDWLTNKPRFYEWLDKHPEHCTYDRRREKRPNQITISDGKMIL